MIQIRTEDRAKLGLLGRSLVLVISLGAGLLALGLGLALSGKDPVAGIFRVFYSGFFSEYGLPETLAKTVPLLLIGVGLAVAYRGKFWNIGAEGQLLAGALSTIFVGLSFPGLPGYLLIPIMALAGFLGGAFWGALAAALKAKFHINEVISTLMFNYIIIELGTFLVTGPLKAQGKQGQNLSADLSANGTLWVVEGTHIAFFTVILALILLLVVGLLVYRSKFGYEVRVLGENPEAARYAGISKTKTSFWIMVISGGLAGLAGFNEIAGNHHHLTQPLTISANLGFTGIIVAWLARLNPWMVPFSAFFFAGVLQGGIGLQTAMNLPGATIDIFNGVILIFLIMGEYFSQTKLKITRTKGGK